MRYVLIHTVDPDLTPPGPESQCADPDGLSAWLDELDGAKTGLHGGRLRPAADATTVKIRDGRLTVTDGPFTETKEQVAGYDVLECASLDEAVAWAGKHPTIRMGAIEVRALADYASAEVLPDPDAGKTRYMLLVCTDPAVDPSVFDDLAPVDPWVTDTDSRGIRRFGSELGPREGARTVRARNGQVIVSDGPFAETKEQIAGFDLLDCADLDEALEIASRHPMARGGILEVRPLWPSEES